MASNDEATAPKEGGEGSVPMLVCKSCQAPLCLTEDIMTDKAEIWTEQVYAYELDMLQKEDIWVYSATNPSQNRFDVARVRGAIGTPAKLASKSDEAAPTESDVGTANEEPEHPHPLAHTIALDCNGGFSPDHSWFPGFSWCMASCKACNAGLGWGFAPNARVAEYRMEFDSRGRRRRPSRRVRREGSQEHSEDTQPTQEGAEQSSSATGEEGKETEASEVEVTAPDERNVAFIGLIITNCRERQLNLAEAVERRRQGERHRLRLMEVIRSFMVWMRQRQQLAEEPLAFMPPESFPRRRGDIEPNPEEAKENSDVDEDPDEMIPPSEEAVQRGRTIRDNVANILDEALGPNVYQVLMPVLMGGEADEDQVNALVSVHTRTVQRIRDLGLEDVLTTDGAPQRGGGRGGAAAAAAGAIVLPPHSDDDDDEEEWEDAEDDEDGEDFTEETSEDDAMDV